VVRFTGLRLVQFLHCRGAKIRRKSLPDLVGGVDLAKFRSIRDCMASLQAKKFSQNGAKLTLYCSCLLPDSSRLTGAVVPRHIRNTQTTRPAHTHHLPGACAPATQESAMMTSGRPNDIGYFQTTPIDKYHAGSRFIWRISCCRWRHWLTFFQSAFPYEKIQFHQKAARREKA
jgi:hypothetical protein